MLKLLLESIEEMFDKHPIFSVIALIVLSLWIAALCVEFSEIMITIFVITLCCLPILWIAIVIWKTVVKFDKKK